MVDYTMIEPQRLQRVYRHLLHDEGQSVRTRRVYDIMCRDHETGYITTRDEVVIEQIEMEMFDGNCMGSRPNGGYCCVL